MKRKEIGGMRSEWKRTERRYNEALREWRESRAFSELSLVALVVPLLRCSGICAAGEK